MQTAYNFNCYIPNKSFLIIGNIFFKIIAQHSTRSTIGRDSSLKLLKRYGALKRYGVLKRYGAL